MIEFEGDVMSDLSVFHRIDDMYTMGSRRWAQLVRRLIAYQGSVQLRMKVESQALQDRPAAPVPEPAAPRQPDGGGVLRAQDGTVLLPGPPSPWLNDPARGPAEVVESTPAALKFSAIGDMFSFGQG